MGLPAPDCVIYLSTPVNVAVERMRQREAATNTHADIHEKDIAYLKKCSQCALDAAKYYGWRRVNSLTDAGTQKTVQQIHDEIYSIVQAQL